MRGDPAACTAQSSTPLLVRAASGPLPVVLCEYEGGGDHGDSGRRPQVLASEAGQQGPWDRRCPDFLHVRALPCAAGAGLTLSLWLRSHAPWVGWGCGGCARERGPWGVLAPGAPARQGGQARGRAGIYLPGRGFRGGAALAIRAPGWRRVALLAAEPGQGRRPRAAGRGGREPRGRTDGDPARARGAGGSQKGRGAGASHL